MHLRRISILGVGLMGGSVGLALRAAARDLQVTGYSNRSDELAHAVERGAITESAADPVKAVEGSDLVILCTPVGLFGELLHAIGPAMKPGTIVTDIGSTKRSVAEIARQALPPGVDFVGSHPMVGGEKHGIENARADLFTNALCIVTPTESTDAGAMESVEKFWQTLNMRTTRMSPDQHDQLTADISHLPHAIAAALVRIQSPQSLKLAARGFADSTRIAAGDPALWRDILLDNRDNLRDGIVRIQRELLQLLEYLDAQDAPAVAEWLKTAADVRKQM